MVRKLYGCGKCVKVFNSETEAEDHEEIPLIEVLKGFTYVRNSPLRGENGWVWIVGDDTTSEVSLLNSSHGVEYTLYGLTDFHVPSRDSLTLSTVPYSDAGSIIRAVTGPLDEYRPATEDDVRLVLSYEGTVESLKRHGLTSLALDLKGERTFPLVYSGEPART